MATKKKAICKNCEHYKIKASRCMLYFPRNVYDAKEDDFCSNYKERENDG